MKPSRFFVEWESNRAVREHHESGVTRGTHAGAIHDCYGCQDSEPSQFMRHRNFANLAPAITYAKGLIAKDWGCLVSIYERTGIREDAYAPGRWDWEEEHVASEPFDDPQAIGWGRALEAVTA